MTPERRAELIEEIDGGQLRKLFTWAFHVAQDDRLSVARKAEAMMEIAEGINQLLTPYTPCGKGCSHCCHMAVAITGWEADLIARYTGRTPKNPGRTGVTGDSIQDDLLDRYTGVPCTFLGADGKCTVYPVRPIACRAHHSLMDDETNCKIEPACPPGGHQLVPSIDLTIFLALAMSTLLTETFGDIREFFPTER